MLWTALPFQSRSLINHFCITFSFVHFIPVFLFQQRVEDMKLMASRPFAKVCLAFSDHNERKTHKVSKVEKFSILRGFFKLFCTSTRSKLLVNLKRPFRKSVHENFAMDRMQLVALQSVCLALPSLLMSW